MQEVYRAHNAGAVAGTGAMQKNDGKADDILFELIEGNMSFQKKNYELYEALKDRQTPQVTLLTCSDSRVPEEVFGISALNKIFTVKNIGNQVKASEGSVKYGLFHLHTPLLLVLGHTGCGAIQAGLSDYTAEDEAIQENLITLQEPLRMHKLRMHKMDNLESNSTTDNVMRLAKFAQANVDYQVACLMRQPLVAEKVKSGELTIVGALFDIHDVFNDGPGHFHIINLNNNIDLSYIKSHRQLRMLSKEIVDLKVKRL